MLIAAGSEAFARPLGYAEAVTIPLWVHRITRGGDSELIPAAVTRDGSTIGISPTHA